MSRTRRNEAVSIPRFGIATAQDTCRKLRASTCTAHRRAFPAVTFLVIDTSHPPHPPHRTANTRDPRSHRTISSHPHTLRTLSTLPAPPSPTTLRFQLAFPDRKHCTYTFISTLFPPTCPQPGVLLCLVKQSTQFRHTPLFYPTPSKCLEQARPSPQECLP